MTYDPKPLKTCAVELPVEIAPIIERLAEHNHDIWARQRMADGWTWGPQRDDTRKQHPCLVPFDELPESERVYDRNAAIETLKTIVSLGYEIVKKRPA